MIVKHLAFCFYVHSNKGCFFHDYHFEMLHDVEIQSWLKWYAQVLVAKLCNEDSLSIALKQSFICLASTADILVFSFTQQKDHNNSFVEE